MLSQWECLLKNVGEWQGSFTSFSPQGEELEDIPTVISLEGLNNSQTIRQVVRRSPPNQPPEEKVLEYSSLNRSILFFDNGAFSQGSLQWGPFAEFGAEFSLIEGDCRLRMVQFFNKEGRFDRLTLIREKLAGINSNFRPPLTAEQLVGEWRGKAVTMYRDLRTPDTYDTNLKLDIQGDRLTQKLTFGIANSVRTISSTAQINDRLLQFDRSDPPVQILLLPDGASCNTPVEIRAGSGFVLEVGWLLTPQRRQRLIRNYSPQGEWVNLTLVEEEKIN